MNLKFRFYGCSLVSQRQAFAGNSPVRIFAGLRTYGFGIESSTRVGCRNGTQVGAKQDSGLQFELPVCELRWLSTMFTGQL